MTKEKSSETEEENTLSRAMISSLKPLHTDIKKLLNSNKDTTIKVGNSDTYKDSDLDINRDFPIAHHQEEKFSGIIRNARLEKGICKNCKRVVARDVHHPTAPDIRIKSKELNYCSTCDTFSDSSESNCVNCEQPHSHITSRKKLNEILDLKRDEEEEDDSDDSEDEDDE